MLIFFGLLVLVLARKVFLRYESSPWEREWLANVNQWYNKECHILSKLDQRQRSMSAVFKAQQRNRLLRLNPTPPVAFADEALLSKMVYHCGLHEVVEYIEPLVGILRDPLTVCGQVSLQGQILETPETSGVFNHGEGYWQSKRFFIVGPGGASDNTNHSRCESMSSPCSRRYLFDLGASTYAAWDGDSTAIGSKWLVERYAAFNMHFDHIYAFEFVKRDPTVVFRGIPMNILARYSYFNIGVNATLSSPFNFWNFVREVASVDDHVTIKLDIDSPGIEEEFIRQIKSSPQLLSLVDEMFYEDHVETLAMHSMWGANGKRKLVDTYNDFIFLRKHGIRMHSWP